MKKTVLIFLTAAVIMLALSACTADTSGYVFELTSAKWISELDGGAKAELSFENDIATLLLNSGNAKTSIKGKYIADEKTFVIFMPEIAQNYTFEYTVKGETLQLKYNNSAINMTKFG